MNKQAKLVKKMHKYVINSGDEELYMRWIYLVPDEPSDQDFIDIADDPEEYHDVLELFAKIATKGCQ